MTNLIDSNAPSAILTPTVRPATIERRFQFWVPWIAMACSSPDWDEWRTLHRERLLDCFAHSITLIMIRKHNLDDPIVEPDRYQFRLKRYLDRRLKYATQRGRRSRMQLQAGKGDIS